MKQNPLFSLETDIIRYAKNIWNDLQVGELESEAPNWDQKRLKIIDVLQSNKKRFQQYEKNGMALKLWGLVDPDQVRHHFRSTSGPLPVAFW